MMFSSSSKLAPRLILSRSVSRTWSTIRSYPIWVVPTGRVAETGDSSDDKLPVALQLLAVDHDRAARTQAPHTVPVDGGVVLTAGLGVARADGHVHRPADLLVEQDLLVAGGDAVVRADAGLAEAPGAVGGAQHLEQQLLAAVGGGVLDAAVLEPEAHAGHLRPPVPGREPERHLALPRVLDRPREELAVRHVVPAHTGDEGAPAD